MNDRLLQAKTLLLDGGYTCAILKGEQSYTSTLRGVGPLLRWLDEGTDLRGAAAADKVVGKGAAFLYVLLGVACVYALVISESALETLKSYGIEAHYDTLVPAIRNRDNTGFCPMESAVRDIGDAQEALGALRAKVKELAGK